MNFQKTICFLAALLLTLGIGVPDSFAQDVTDISLVVSPRTLRDSVTANGGDITVKATVRVTLEDGAAAGQTVGIRINGTMDDSYSLSNNTVEVVFDEGESSKSLRHNLIFKVKDDDDAEDEKITLTAFETADSSDDRPKGTAMITITDHAVTMTASAVSARGIRVIISKPVAGAMARRGKDQVIVRVLRKAGLAEEFGAFRNIEVALRSRKNTPTNLNDDKDLYSLDIHDDKQLSTLVLSRVKTAELTGNATGMIPGAPSDNTKAFYTRRSSSTGYDTLEFRFHLTSGEHEDVYARATIGTFTDNGDSTTKTIDNIDEKTSIFPASPSSFPGVVVGDGKTFSIDATVPSREIVKDIAVMINGDAIEDDGTSIAGIGNKIKISVDLVDFGNNNTLQLHVLTAAAVTADDNGTPVELTAVNKFLSGYTKIFSALDVIGATSQGKPVEAEFTVAKNQFMLTAEANHPDGDFKKKENYEYDNVSVKIRAVIKDRAGNTGQQNTNESDAFILDSKPPGVTILYPKPSGTDSTRFSAMVEQLDVDFLGESGIQSYLKPLNFETDEVVTHLWIIIGKDTLIVNPITEGPTVAIDDSNDDTVDGYDLTDAASYPLKNTMTGKKKNARPDADLDPAKKPAGGFVKLQVVAIDRAGNKGTGTPDGGDAIFDPNAPAIKLLFPTNAALKELNDKVGGAEETQNPVFTINEETDSILVRYEGGGTLLSVPGTAADEAKVNKDIMVAFMGDDALTDGEVYDLQIYARDLVGHVGVSDPALSQDLEFDADLNNPQADGFTVALAATKIDSAVAGQDLGLKITAMDGSLMNTAITYINSATVVTMDSDGNTVDLMTYSGDDVTDNGDGTATLESAGWSIGVHNIKLNSKTAGGPYTVAVKDGDDDNIMGTIEGIVIDAADFDGFKITALENGVSVTEVWGDFDLHVVPVDEYGNPSVKAYSKALPDKPSADEVRAVLDTRVIDAGTEDTADDADIVGIVFDEIDVTFRSNPALDDLPSLFEWPLSVEGETFELIAPDNKSSVTIQAEAVEDHDRVMGLKSTVRFTIRQPLMPVLTLWGPNGENLTDESALTVPSGESLMVTFLVALGSAGAGETVTFTKDGETTDVTADDDGNASLPVTLSGEGSISVSAISGQYPADTELSYTYEEGDAGPMLMKFTDANGDPVYLINLTDNTVGLDDYDLFTNAWGKSMGDDINGDGTADDDDVQIFLQSDITPLEGPDGMVNLADYTEFVMSWGRTADPGPATKPIVLLPGINENAEFSLSLGSERVVAGELVAVDVSVANVEALVSYGFTLNYDTDKFEFVSVAPADEDLLTSTGGETPMFFHHLLADGQVQVANGLVNGTAVSGGGDIVRFVFRVLYGFEDSARFEIADGLVFDPTSLSNPVVVAGVLELQSTPREFALHQNFPNPFNPDTTIKYDLAESADITLQIYNVLGQVVRTLVASEAQNAGRYQIRWNGMDDRGVPVSSGVYFYQISAEGKFQQVQKLMLLK